MNGPANLFKKPCFYCYELDVNEMSQILTINLMDDPFPMTIYGLLHCIITNLIIAIILMIICFFDFGS